jgi:NAD(P)-dependent dehydrogenase (short-subunit alcohol dehydrogenase family)
MVTAVVTGAAGDLGQALCEAFVAEGYRVYGGDIAPVERGWCRCISTLPIALRCSRLRSAPRPKRRP